MEKSKGTVALIGLAFVAGGIVVWILVTVLGAKPSKVNVGPIEFEMPTDTPVPLTSTRMPPAATSAPPTLTPVLPTATPILPTPTSVPPTPTSVPVVVPPTAASPEGTGPFREHKTASIGTGVFTQVTFSDGLAPYTEDWLWANNHFNIQRIRLEENPNGCGISVYDTDKVWFSASSPNAIFTVNGEEIGRLSILTGKHGYVFSWPIHVGDEVCAIDFGPSGYQIVFGPDMYYHYDSYCYRGNC